MSHLIKIYAVCKFSYFSSLVLKEFNEAFRCMVVWLFWVCLLIDAVFQPIYRAFSQRGGGRKHPKQSPLAPAANTTCPCRTISQTNRHWKLPSKPKSDIFFS